MVRAPGYEPNDTAWAKNLPLGRFGQPEEIAGSGGVPRIRPGCLRHGCGVVGGRRGHGRRPRSLRLNLVPDCAL